MQLMQQMLARRSVRDYTGEAVTEEQLRLILQAGLCAPSSKNRRPWQMIVVRDKEMLNKMADYRASGAQMLRGADCAIVVLGDESLTDVWCEDCSIVMTQMHLMADALGLGSCWIQGRLRQAADGSTGEEYLRRLLAFPEQLRLAAVLSVGVPAEHRPPYTAEDLLWDKVHYGSWGGK